MSVVDCSGVGLERMGGVLVLSDITKLYKAKCPGHVDSARIQHQAIKCYKKLLGLTVNGNPLIMLRSTISNSVISCLVKCLI